MTSESHQIRFIAEVYKVQTVVDGGIRLTVNLPETAIAEAGLLMECKRQSIALDVVCSALSSTPKPVKKSKWVEKQEETSDVEEGRIGEQEGQAAEEQGDDGDPETGWQQDDYYPQGEEDSAQEGDS
jgi:hypothetical protein